MKKTMAVLLDEVGGYELNKMVREYFDTGWALIDPDGSVEIGEVGTVANDADLVSMMNANYGDNWERLDEEN